MSSPWHFYKNTVNTQNDDKINNLLIKDEHDIHRLLCNNIKSFNFTLSQILTYRE